MSNTAPPAPDPDPFLGDAVFVYGTLRSGFVNNPATIAFRTGATLLGAGRLPGTLYSVGWYPALIEESDGEVFGEVWRLDTPGLMQVLDEYEGLTDPGPPEYERVRRQVRMSDGIAEAWVYLYLYRVDPAQRIPEGDWAAAFNDPQAQGL